MGLKEIQELKNNAGNKPTKTYIIPKKSKKKLAQEKAQKELGGDSEEKKWYKQRQKFLTGKCMICGTEYDKNNFRYAVNATAHILSKADFPSVKTHPLNWLELPSICCHYKFDYLLSWGEKKELPIWGLIVERFIMIEPNIAQEERSRIPEELLETIKQPI